MLNEENHRIRTMVWWPVCVGLSVVRKQNVIDSTDDDVSFTENVSKLDNVIQMVSYVIQYAAVNSNKFKIRQTVINLSNGRWKWKSNEIPKTHTKCKEKNTLNLKGTL